MSGSKVWLWRRKFVTYFPPPPVRSKVTGVPSSSSMEETNQSIMAAVPATAPESIHSAVFFPTIRVGISSSS